MAEKYPMRFSLKRAEARVALGVLWPDGSVSLRWLGEFPSAVFFSDYGHAMHVHHIGEPGSERWTTAEWMDGVCFACGSPVAENAMMAGNGGQCARCSASWSGPPSWFPEPEKGTWRAFEMPAAESSDAV